MTEIISQSLKLKITFILYHIEYTGFLTNMRSLICVKSEHSIVRVNESLIKFRRQLAMKKNHQFNLEF